MNSNFTKDFQRFLEGKKKEKNPLEVIGFSPSILETGLSLNEMHDYCKRSARILVSIVHPDSKGGVDNPKIRRFTEILKSLENLKVFEEAVNEFRALHTWQKRGEEAIQKQCEGLVREVEHLKNLLQNSEDARDWESRFRKWIFRYLEKQAMSPFLKGTKTLTECQEVVVASFYLMPCDPPDKNVPKELQNPKLFNSTVQQIINKGNFDAIKVSQLIQRVLDSSIEFPAVCWTQNLALREMGFQVSLNREERKRVVSSTTIPGAGQEVAQRYRKFLHEFLQIFGDMYTNKFRIIPEILRIKNGFIKDSLDGYSLFVVGSAPLDLAARYLTSSGSLYRFSAKDDLLLLAEPFLAPDRVIVTMLAQPRRRCKCEKAKLILSHFIVALL